MTMFDNILAKVSTWFMGIALFLELAAIYKYIGTSLKDMPLWVYSVVILFVVGIAIKCYVFKKYN